MTATYLNAVNFLTDEENIDFNTILDCSAPGDLKHFWLARLCLKVRVSITVNVYKIAKSGNTAGEEQRVWRDHRMVFLSSISSAKNTHAGQLRWIAGCVTAKITQWKIIGTIPHGFKVERSALPPHSHQFIGHLAIRAPDATLQPIILAGTCRLWYFVSGNQALDSNSISIAWFFFQR